MAFNPLYLLLIVPALLGWWAQARVRDIYRKYSEQRSLSGASGEVVAHKLLQAHNLGQVGVRRIQGTLTDHYNPQDESLNLTAATADGASVTAMGIVAHEVGHAVQDAEGYRLLQLRNTLAKPLGMAASLSSLVFIGGMFMGIPILRALGVLMLAGMTIFAIVTLPVERNASTRALAMLERSGLSSAEDRKGVRTVLRAAAFTYLAATGQRIANFLFFILLALTALGVWGG
ncbi:MAG: zinc metallopeptidase [Chloroflexota bacterium]